MHVFTFQENDETDAHEANRQVNLRIAGRAHLELMRKHFHGSASSSTTTLPVPTSSTMTVPPPNHVTWPAVAAPGTSQPSSNALVCNAGAP